MTTRFFSRVMVSLVVLFGWNFLVCPMYQIDLLWQDIGTILMATVYVFWVLDLFRAGS